jgi:hypothetical protein
MAGLDHADTGGAERNAERSRSFLDRRVHVDGRVKPGHDGKVVLLANRPCSLATLTPRRRRGEG